MIEELKNAGILTTHRSLSSDSRVSAPFATPGAIAEEVVRLADLGRLDNLDKLDPMVIQLASLSNIAFISENPTAFFFVIHRMLECS